MRRDLSTWIGTLRTTSRTAKFRRSNRPLKARGAAAKISLAGGEPLDSRKMLAVTANLVGSGLAISLDANNDVAGLVFNTGTSKYEVYDNTTLVDSFAVANVSTIEVLDTKGGGGTGQVFEVRDGGTITASLGVSNSIETTKIFDDINVTSKTSIPGGYGVVIGSPSIILDDATLADPLSIGTSNTEIQFDGVVTLVGGTDAHINSGSGAGDIDFLDDILGGGEDGSGTLTLTAGTGAISFGGTIGGAGVGEDIGGVLINSAASVSATGKFYLDGTIPTAYDAGLTVADGVNNVNFANGGEISGFGEDAGIVFKGSSTNSTIAQFKVWNNGAGMVFGGRIEGEADLSGTVVDNNDVYDNVDDGIDVYNVAGNLDGEDAFVIGGEDGNRIYGNGYDGIYATSSTGVEILNNAIYDNGFASDGSGINLEEGGEYLIAGNQIGEDLPGFGNAINGITIDGEDGFYSYAGTVIEYNTIEYNREYGVRMQGVTLDAGEDSILIFDNTIVHNGFTALPVRALTEIGGVRIDGSQNIRLINNTINNNGEDPTGNGVDIVNGSHGTVVFNNAVVFNANNGIYVQDSSTLTNPVRIGDVLPTTASTGTTVTVEGDQRAFILVGQTVYLVAGSSFLRGPAIQNADIDSKDVTGVSYDAVNDLTTLTFASLAGPYSAVSLGNAIADNGEDGLTGHGISVLASGEGVGSVVVQGLEILGNSVIGNGLDGMHLEATRAATFGDLSDILIAGNFIGREPLEGIDVGNYDDGIEVINGEDIAIFENYIAANGGAPSDVNDRNGIEIRASRYVDIGGEGEDGSSLGNYIARNANDGVDIKGSQFVDIVNNEIAFNGDDGIDIEAYLATRSADILIAGNWIHDNTAKGIEIDDADVVEIVDNLIENNGDAGVRAQNSTDVTVAFNIIRDHLDDDGVRFFASTGTIEGNEIYDNGDDGVEVDGDGEFNGIVDVLGNIIRENGNDGVRFRDGNFAGEDEDGPRYSVVGGNTIERNTDDGVSLTRVSGVQVGGRFPSDINFINLNSTGVYVNGHFDPIGEDIPVGSRNVSILGNEIDSNTEYGVWLDSAEDAIVGAGYSYDLSSGEYTSYAGPEAANTIRRNGVAGVFAEGYTREVAVFNNDISENPIGVMITSAFGFDGSGPFGGGLVVGGPSFPGEDSTIGTLGNRILDNGEGVRATGDAYGTIVTGNLIENNLTGATLASVRGLTFGYGEATGAPASLGFGNIVQNNNEGLRGSGDLTDTVVAGNEFLANTKVGIALQSAKNLTVGGFLGEDTANVIFGSPIGLSASGTMVGTEVVGNEFSDNTIGIALSKATGMVVGGNTVDASGKYGISVTGNNADTLIVENTVTNTQGQPGFEHGIYLNGARNVDVIDNTVSESKGAGIYVTGNTAGTVVQGNYLDGNRFGIALINA
ncbi:MAG: beta strand repeat-containing protein, partial [Planctomycetia bacterium]